MQGEELQLRDPSAYSQQCSLTSQLLPLRRWLFLVITPFELWLHSMQGWMAVLLPLPALITPPASFFYFVKLAKQLDIVHN